MRKDLLIIALALLAAAGTAAADVLAVPETSARSSVTLPAKGVTMAAVEKKYGMPASKRPAVGGDSPKHPPITRWDYEGFSVIFENDRVIDAVIPGAPPRVYHQDQLTPVASSAAPLPPMTPAAPAPEPAAEPIVPEAPVEAAPEAPPAEASMAPPAEAPAATEPAAPAETPPPADAPPVYSDQPSPETPPQGVPQDQPPTPK
jgi:hypothetical protein